MNSEWKDRLAAYDDEGLDPRERAALDQLLQTDAEARAYLTALRADRELVRDVFGQVHAEPGFAAKVMERLPKRRALVPLPRLLEVCAAALLVLVAGSLLSPTRSAERARQIRCQESVRDLTMAMFLYSQDYDNRLPDAGHWAVQVSTHAPDRTSFKCPSDTGPGTLSYAMPIGLSGADLAAVQGGDNQPVLFDSYGLMLAPRHSRAANVSFTDGRVLAVTEGEYLNGLGAISHR